MAELKKYWVPDYYDEFHCKGPDCRASCCHGWGISLSMKEYFRLLGMNCEPELRRKLDCAFHRVDFPTEDRYAQITPDWRGDCPLHMENGYCRLQKECGENALAAICRYYPRSPRTAFANECACSNSCEGVLERMFERQDSLKLTEKTLAFEIPDGDFKEQDWRAEYYPEVRELCLATLQRRENPIRDRLILLGEILERLHNAFIGREEAVIAQTLKECNAMQPERIDGNTREDELFALNIQHHMSMIFGENSMSVQEYAHAIENALGLEGKEAPAKMALETALERYRAAAKHFERVLPQWQIYFEHMMVNHAFYESFPFSNRFENLWEEYLSLCATYAFVRYLAICWMWDKNDINAFVDVCAAAFRLIEHSSFDRNAASLMESMKARTLEAMKKLVGA